MAVFPWEAPFKASVEVSFVVRVKAPGPLSVKDPLTTAFDIWSNILFDTPFKVRLVVVTPLVLVMIL